MVKESNLEARNRGLIDLSNTLDDLQIPFMLSDGVLLGAVREGNFIKWDWDVELSIKVEDIFDKSDRLLEALKDEDFVLDNIDLKWENYKINVYKYNNKYSLIGFYEQGVNRLRTAWVYPSIFFDNLEEYIFLGNKYMVPSPPEEYLKYQYGDWETPIRDTVKRNYLTSTVYREKIYYQQPLNFVQNKIRGLLTKIRNRFKGYFLIYSSRDSLFQKMYEFCLSDNIHIIEIGASDGREACLMLKRMEKKINSMYIIEPNIKNIKSAKKAISRYDLYSRVKYYHAAIGPVTEKGTFYLSSMASNLNSTTNNSGKVDIEYINLEDFVHRNSIAVPIIIKMDIEGYEIEVMQSEIDYLIRTPNIYILFKTNQNAYSKTRSMYRILDKLFNNGYSPLMLESEGVRIPKMFKEKGMEPVAFDKNRALYHCSDKDFVKDVCSKNIQEKITSHYMTPKIVRSLLISNRQDTDLI